MTAPTAPAPELVALSGMACQRSGRGKGCTRLRWHECRTCGWSGDLWDGDQPPVTDFAHVCDPADVERRRRIVDGG
ncbi:hypothetical protein [Micromonospora sp. HM5-17]|uniref:hypothetical protein n=1 Tax=Micromonospora sp. HM5-17 TaxID=2487710 RepID=UPI000F49798D|nr:hypothetical protein [Micromonospora sp. HM5-17]ROT27229.1 hypothetical protein EF879_23550 [Micromonospora sp. HM5-17]